MGQTAFKTLSTKMKQDYFREKYEYIFGKKFRKDVYVPQKMETETDTYYPDFYLDNDTNWYDYKFEKFASKKIHQKYLDESDVAWSYRYNELHKRSEKLYNKCRNKYWRQRKRMGYMKYQFNINGKIKYDNSEEWNKMIKAIKDKHKV